VAPRVGVYAWYVFWLMCGLNFINYLDRFVFTAVSDTIQTQFHFNDTQFGLFSTAFLVVYALVAFPLGYLSERFSRKIVVAIGVAIWSIATLLTGRATGFNSMFAARAVVGVGEGSYYPSGTPILAAWFPAKRRSSILALWGASSLVGAAVGTLFGGFFDYPDKWRDVFVICAIPGLILAVLMFFLRERKRAEDDPEVSGAPAPKLWETIRRCWAIPSWRAILFQHILGFFPLAATSAWLVIYLSATYGVNSDFGPASLSHSMAPILGGGLLVVGGIAGGIYGGVWANRMSRKHIGARIRTGGLGFLWAAPFLVGALGAPYVLRAIPAYMALAPKTQVTVGVAVFAVFGLGAAFFLNVYNGPTSAALQDVLPPDLRAAGGGLELALAHILGDIYAAALVGLIADNLGNALGGQQIGLALLITCPFFLIAAGIVGIWGSKFYRGDVERLGVSAETMVGA
jgi:predicted MFS family arabinose efflux permease